VTGRGAVTGGPPPGHGAPARGGPPAPDDHRAAGPSPVDPEPPSRTRRWFGAAGGLGFAPLAPGTWGSLGAALAAAGLCGVRGWFEGPVGLAGPALLVALAAVLLALTVLGVRLGDRAGQDWGRDDPGGFVLDEVVGQLLALAPALATGLAPLTLAAGFLAFRLFDIVKPPPCRRLEALHGGVGIMADDLVAGVYAAVVVLLAAAV